MEVLHYSVLSGILETWRVSWFKYNNTVSGYIISELGLPTGGVPQSIMVVLFSM